MQHDQLLNNDPDALFGLPIFPVKPAGGGLTEKMELSRTVDKSADDFSAKQALAQIQERKDTEWLDRGRNRALHLFHAMAAYVPAYQKFLQECGIDAEHIKSVGDFLRVPVIDKENYLQKYPIEELMWHGRIDYAHMVVASSGSFNKPFLWPRGRISEMYSILEHELSMVPAYDLEHKSTLFIVSFAMGMHIAGTITMQSIHHLADKGYPVSVITPGYVTENILGIIPELATKYDQIVLAGYPPYLKEVIDQGASQGINWKGMEVKFLLAGEGFNESWRSYMAELVNADPLKDFINIYGSADAAAMGIETVTSIQVRRAIAEHDGLAQQAFDDERVAFLYQFYPEHIYFESVDGELVLSTPGGIPLVRYNIHDRGNILTKEEILKRAPTLTSTFEKLNTTGTSNNLPFVYLFGRSNQMVILYGANIYLEHIREALEAEDIRQHVSGKVVMKVDLDDNHDQRLYIDVEQSKDNADIDKQDEIQKKIHQMLLQKNSEYRSSFNGTGDKVKPIVTMRSYGDEMFRSARMKHSWTKPKS